MPKIRAEFAVECVEIPAKPFSICVHLTSVASFWELVDLGFEEMTGIPRGECGGQIDVRTDVDDPRLAKALQIVERNGFRPSNHFIVPPELSEKEFALRRHREYSPEELDSPRFLRLAPRFCEDVMAEWIGGSDAGGWVARAKARGRRLQIGHFDSFEAILLGSELKKMLEEAGLQELNFLPVTYHKPSPDLRQLWQFGHETLMPPCLLTRQDDRGEIVDGVGSIGCYWDDGGYLPQELVFAEKDVVRMPPWDMAVTREKIGFHPGHYRSEVIVSQRLREVLRRVKSKSIGYAPVRLV